MSARFPMCVWGAHLMTEMCETASKSDLVIPAPWQAHPCAPSPILCCGGTVHPTARCGSDGTSLLRLDYKRCCGFQCGHTYSLLDHLLWGNGSCQVLGIPQKLYWRSPCGEKLMSPTNSHMSKHSWRCIFQPQSSLQMIAAPADRSLHNTLIRDPEPESPR